MRNRTLTYTCILEKNKIHAQFFGVTSMGGDLSASSLAPGLLLLTPLAGRATWVYLCRIRKRAADSLLSTRFVRAGGERS